MLDLVGGAGERPDPDQLISWKIGHIVWSSRFLIWDEKVLTGIQRPGPNLWGAGAGMEFLTPSNEFRLLSFHWTGSIA